MDLSVVIASLDAAHSIGPCLDHLREACRDFRSELIVVDASDDATAELVKRMGQDVTLIRLPVGRLTPQLWAAGYRRSSGRIVAFTTAHCLVTPGWARALVRAIDDGAAGAGGPLVLGPEASRLDGAVYFLRYAGFMPHAIGTGRIAGEIAGDNAAYARASLDHHASAFGQGFWEVDFHRLVRADGGWLAGVPEAFVEFGRSFRPGTILRHRFAHGRHFGAGRVQAGTRASWQILAAAPIVPLVLAGRSARHALSGGAFTRFAASLPWFLTLAGAWALGEAWGAWRPSFADSPDGSGAD